MPQAHRQKGSGALIFVPTPEEEGIIEMSKHLKMQVSEMDEKITKLNDLLERVQEKVDR